MDNKYTLKNGQICKIPIHLAHLYFPKIGGGWCPPCHCRKGSFLPPWNLPRYVLLYNPDLDIILMPTLTFNHTIPHHSIAVTLVHSKNAVSVCRRSQQVLACCRNKVNANGRIINIRWVVTSWRFPTNAF